MFVCKKVCKFTHSKLIKKFLSILSFQGIIIYKDSILLKKHQRI